MNHEAASAKLLELAYGELPAGEARAVEAHAAGCPECREELGRIRDTRALMALLPVEPPPERGEAIVLAAARQAAERRAGRRGLLPPWLWAGSIGAVAVAAVAVVSWQLAKSPGAGPLRSREAELMGPPPAAVASAPAPASPAPTGAGAAPSAVEAAKAAPEPEPLAEAAPPPRQAAKRAPAPARPPSPAARAKEEALAKGTGGLGILGGAGEGRGGAGAGAAGLRTDFADRETPAERAGPVRDDALAAARSEAAGAPAAAPAPMLAPAAPSGAVSAPVPAQKARAMAPAERKSAGPEEGRAAALRAEAAPGSVETRSFDRCPGERARIVQRDAEGRLVLYVRFLADSRRIEQKYGPDGRLIGASSSEGKVARFLPLDTPWLVHDARDAGIDAPPRCAVP